MSKQTKHFYEFGGFRLDLNERLLLRQGKVVALTPKAFETLLVLVEHSGRIVEKEVLMNRIWPDTFVEEVSLARNVSALRKALGERDGDIQFIETFPKRGYRFVAVVTEHKLDQSERNASPALEIPPPIAEVLVSSSAKEAEQSYGAEFGLTAQPDEQKLVQGLPQPELMSSSIALGDVVNGGAFAATSNKATASAQSPESLSGKQNFVGFLNRHKIAGLLALLALLLGVVITAYVLRTDNDSISTFQEMKIVRLTDNGNAGNPAISPDGKYVAYEISENRRHSIWVKDIASNSEVQIVAPTENNFIGLTFSPNGSYLYYVKLENTAGTLYRSPIFGGESKKLIEGITSHITFSPDGNRFAYIRSIKESSFILESSLMIANADATGEQALATRTKPDLFTGGVAWSPSGKTIACIVGSSSGERLSNLVEIRLEDGSEKPISIRKWSNIGRLAWFADGSHFVISARDQSDSPTQIWLLSYPDGKERRVTNDLADYSGLSLSANSGTLVTRQIALFLNIWVIPELDTSRAKQITVGANNFDGLSWTPDGKIVFSSNKNGYQSLSTMAANGMGEKKLSDDSRKNESPVVSPDGRYIVFSSDRAGSSNIWRMDNDGSNHKQLTHGEIDHFPHLSPDGQWVIYRSSATGQVFKKVSIDGGEPVQLTYDIPRLNSSLLDISPDGKQVAGFYRDMPSSSKWSIAILPFEGGKPLKKFDIPLTFPPRNIRWLPDGQAIAYINTAEGISNIWMQPLDGSPPKQLTNFQSEEIYYFDWSRDGKQLACVRGYSTSNLVSISNFK